MANTVSRNALLAWRVPSLAEVVIRAVPVFPLDGVTLTVRFELLPPKTICETGTNVGFDEAADKMRFAAGVAASPMVKGSGPVDWFF